MSSINLKAGHRQPKNVRSLRRYQALPAMCANSRFLTDFGFDVRGLCLAITEKSRRLLTLEMLLGAHRGSTGLR